jgi:hypothetical protein
VVSGVISQCDVLADIVRMTDWTLQMAYYNFSAALMHVGGQNVYYNVSLSSSSLANII